MINSLFYFSIKSRVDCSLLIYVILNFKNILHREIHIIVEYYNHIKLFLTPFLKLKYSNTRIEGEHTHLLHLAGLSTRDARMSHLWAKVLLLPLRHFRACLFIKTAVPKLYVNAIRLGIIVFFSLAVYLICRHTDAFV